MDGTMFVGLDVHVQTIALAVTRGDSAAEELGVISNTPNALAKRRRKLGPPERLQVCYEAGPCGYAIQRQLSGLGIDCRVVAPSLIPVRPGDRVKTDRRDAAKLARLLRSGDLTSVAVPTPEQEALRDLSRAREAAVGDRHRVRQRLVKLLARHGIAEPAGKRWTKTYGAWVSSVTLAEPAAVSTPAPVIAALQQLHGVGLITAVGIVAEVGDLARFDRPAQLFAYAGLVPSEHSSGGRQQRGHITKTGNRHLRFLLVEAAWHDARPVRLPTGEPTDAVAAVAATARGRLPRRYFRLVGRGKSKQAAIVAIARELVGFMWATAQAAQAIPAPVLDVAASEGGTRVG